MLKPLKVLLKNQILIVLPKSRNHVNMKILCNKDRSCQRRSTFEPMFNESQEDFYKTII